MLIRIDPVICATKAPFSRLILILLLLIPAVGIARINSLSGEYLYSYDPVELPGSEKMGLLGGSYILHAGRYLYGGLGVYGAVAGDRGGFFTGGFELGIQQPLFYPFVLRTGIFLGGGGGASAPQGGGLMIRPHAEFVYVDLPWKYGVGWSLVEFSNDGNISSDQATFTIAYQFESWLSSGWPKPLGQIRDLPLPSTSYSREFYLQSESYWPRNGEKRRSGLLLENRLDLIGIRWRQSLGGKWMGEFLTSGAWAGGIDGFAQVMAGTSYRWLSIQRWKAYVGALGGAAGGGDVDTGGGPLFRPFLGLSYNFMNNWQIYAETGYTAALDGGFSASTASLNLGWQYDLLRPATGNTIRFEEENFHWAKFRLRASAQRYRSTDAGDRKREQSVGKPVDQVGLKIDSFVTRNTFLTGQAYGAFDGGAGGYAVGLVGLGYDYPLISKPLRLSLGTELLMGAAGGGGIDVGSGRIAQGMINFGLVKRAWGLEFALGRVTAIDQGLNENVVDIALQYRFAVPHH